MLTTLLGCVRDVAQTSRSATWTKKSFTIFSSRSFRAIWAKYPENGYERFQSKNWNYTMVAKRSEVVIL